MVVDPALQPLFLGGVLQPLVEVPDADPDRRDHAESERGATGDLRDLVERAPEDVADQAEGRAPEPGAHDAVGQEAAVGHPRGAGDERRERADEPEEAADHDRLAAMPIEVVLDLVEALLGDADLRPVPEHELPADLVADEEARAVAGNRTDPHDSD